MASESFPAAMRCVFAQEGGYVDHRLDPGGATHFGITRKTLELWRGRPVSKADVMALDRREAASIYQARYWLPCNADRLPAGIDLMVFDLAVHSGVRRAQSLVAEALSTLPQGTASPLETQIDAIGQRRLSFLKKLPGFPVFGRGWSRRVSAVTATAHALAKSNRSKELTHA
jgi:lysozyme family protein